MGVPYFQVKELAEAHGIVAFSSNYALYADISSRVMTTLEQLATSVQCQLSIKAQESDIVWKVKNCYLIRDISHEK